MLDTKSREIHFVHPYDTVRDALKKTKDKDIGAVLVKEYDRLVGIFTERHDTRKVFLKDKSSPKTQVREVMKTNVVCVDPEQTAEACMALMTEKRIRHLPVMRSESLIGVISIGYLLKSIIADQEFTIEQLEHFIHG